MIDSVIKALMNEQADSHHQQGDLLSAQPIVRALLAHKDWHKSESYSGIEGTNVFGIGTQVETLAWGIISEIPAGNINAPIISALMTLSIIVIILHVIFGLVSLLFTGRLLNPISELAGIMQRATTGDYTRASGASPYREIDTLRSSFNTMIQEINVREKSLRKLTGAIEHLGETLIITNRYGIVEYVNPAFTRTTGYSAEEVIGRSPNIINSGTQAKAFYAELWKTILAGGNWEGRLINRKKDGSRYPVLMSIAPIHDGQEITHFVAIEQDMSAQDLLEEQLRQSQKMEAIGTLVGGIAHDFNNMLAGITGNLYLARSRAHNDPDLIRKLDNIEHLSLRAADMIKQMLTFASKNRVNMTVLRLNPLLVKTINFLSASIPENITLHRALSDQPMQINGDETQIHQVLMNLINNARDAVEGRDNPAITIALDAFQADDAFIETRPYFKPGRYAHLSVSDNGMGIPEHQLAHLFEPFFTTKDQGKGTGLGLAMVFGAIKTHQGFVDVESHEGEGSTFHIYLPLLENQELTATALPDQKPARGKNEVILLADDDTHVRRTTAEVLEALGYRVVQAEDGAQGLDLFQAHAHEVDMLMLDVVMPGCGGPEMAERIRAQHPDLPVIFITGYDKEHLSGNPVHMHRCEILSKPVQFDNLSHTIRQLLDIS
ncbi:MAG: ATP-binding protein [Mariprofundaceae bacterium]|nr:ATP-binding protein [Mariprofundaceae bacterium]